MKLLISGGCGFLGSNIALEALRRGWELVILDNLTRTGSSDNLEWLRLHGPFDFFDADISNEEVSRRLLKDHRPDAVFHLAGQVAMTTSLESPRQDFRVNALGTLNLLEAIREYAPEAVTIYSSTNKVYGDLEQFHYVETETRYVCPSHPYGFDEGIGLSFHSPYGCSKGSADQYMLDYSRMYGLRTIVFRHSSMYGGRQFSTADQGWIGWFCQKAVEQARGSSSRFTISGSGKQVRDVLHADDMVELYFRALDVPIENSGQAFNIGGGVENSLSILELFRILERLTETILQFDTLPFRQSDQKVFIADIGKAQKAFGWFPKVTAEAGIARMLEWIDSMPPTYSVR
jgi:CDP-paratose 2-epimerase